MGRKSLLKSQVPVPPLSLRLLVPPIRLMAAQMWQIVQRCRVVHYGYLDEFVTLVVDIFPDILSHKEIILLSLGLRGRLLLKLCQEDRESAPKTIQPHIDRMRQFVEDLQHIEDSNKDTSTETAVGNFLDLVQNLLKDTNDWNHFFQEVFPSVYGKKFESALQSLMGEFLSRLEQMLPVPDFKEAASLLSDSTSDLELCFQTLTDPEQLKTVLLHKPTTTKFDRETPFGDTILSALSYQPSVAGDQPPLIPDIMPEAGDQQPLIPDIMPEAGDQPPLIPDIESWTSLVNEQESSICLEENGGVDEFTEEFEEDMAEVESENSQKEDRDQCKKTSIKPFEGPKAVKKPHEEDVVEEGSENSQKENLDQCKRTSAKPSKGHRVVKKPRHKAAKKLHVCDEDVTEEESENSHKENGDQCKTTSAKPSKCHKAAKKPHHKCLSCDKTCRSAKGLKIHARLHLHDVALSCTSCKRRFSTDTALRKHMKVHANSLDSGKSSKKSKAKGPFPCSLCGKSHAKPNPPPCDQCGKRYCTYVGLYRHRKLHTGERPYICDLCEKGFSGSDILKAHMLTHTGERAYMCNVCGKAFTQGCALKRHLRIHTGEKPFACKVCSKTFRSKPELELHTRTHTGERPYQCSQCGKRFVASTHLRNHMRTHTGARPHACIHCDKRFGSPDQLRKHLLVHTGEKPHKCPECGKGFSQQGNMKIHLRTHTTCKKT
ncbi:zinc finger protein 572-like isoform X3 [Alosa sapidissima]|uniref:zinc finger protein 572-like isoform X3 n=1 Tax=Alosa sapidissima TaxID=34773 RepID=UPI001C0A2AB5|nr:zinc finger protein 572-like isoform X3 [Alosa sapidissima]